MAGAEQRARCMKELHARMHLSTILYSMMFIITLLSIELNERC